MSGTADHISYKGVEISTLDKRFMLFLNDLTKNKKYFRM